MKSAFVRNESFENLFYLLNTRIHTASIWMASEKKRMADWMHLCILFYIFSFYLWFHFISLWARTYRLFSVFLYLPLNRIQHAHDDIDGGWWCLMPWWLLEMKYEAYEENVSFADDVRVVVIVNKYINMRKSVHQPDLINHNINSHCSAGIR